MTTEVVLVETYWEGKESVYRLPDGTEIRGHSGGGADGWEIIERYLRVERGLTDFRLIFHEAASPRRRRPRTTRKRLAAK